MKKSLAAKLKKIKLLATDVDGVMTDAGMYYGDDGIELKKFSTRDGMGMVLLRKAGYKLAIITSENTKIVAMRAQKLQIGDIYQGAMNKVEAMEDLLKKYSLRWDEIAYIGDDVNDLPVLERVGFAATPSNGTERNKKIADYITKNKGGDGCVREVCDLLIDMKYKGNKINELWSR